MIRNRILLVYSATLFGILAWLGAIMLAPVLQSRGIILGKFLSFCFSAVCHQIPERSFLLFGHPMAVCARCLGIYAGFLIGLIFYPFVRGLTNIRFPRTKIFLAMTLPIVIDTVANFFGLWATSNVLRFSTGLIWGLILPFYFIPGLAELAIKDKKRIE